MEKGKFVLLEERMMRKHKTNKTGLTDSDRVVSIVLAAGEGKRMRSRVSKVLHPLWGVASICRIVDAIDKGLKPKPYQIIVVSPENADQVQKALNKSFRGHCVVQPQPKGTGHAVQIAIHQSIPSTYKGNVYLFPGDMGLIDPLTIDSFQKEVDRKKADLMLFTGRYEGDPLHNYYGRIVRAPFSKKSSKIKERASFSSSQSQQQKVLAIVQHRDIMAMKAADDLYDIKTHGDKIYSFTRKELLDIKEYDALVFAFRADVMRTYTAFLRGHNVQGELYMTDCVNHMVRDGRTVLSTMAKDSRVLMGFNDRKTLSLMQSIARERCYQALNSFITFEDPQDFFIAEEVIKDLMQLAKKQTNIDIFLGKGVFLEGGVCLGKGVLLGRDVVLSGEICLGDGCVVGQRTVMRSLMTGRRRASRIKKMKKTIWLEKGVQVADDCVIEGFVVLREGVQIEHGVSLIGMEKEPTLVMKNAHIKAGSTLESCIIQEKAVVRRCSVLVKQDIPSTKKPSNKA